MKYLLALLLISTPLAYSSEQKINPKGFKWGLSDKKEIIIHSEDKTFLLKTDCSITHKKLQVSSNYRTLKEGNPLRINRKPCLIEQIERLV